MNTTTNKVAKKVWMLTIVGDGAIHPETIRAHDELEAIAIAKRIVRRDWADGGFRDAEVVHCFVESRADRFDFSVLVGGEV